MASLAERESLKGKVQCIYFDPPYGIKFNSNWQVSTQSRDVKDGKQVDISREPEQVKAFRDTWKDGVHSYLTYLRDRLTAMRGLLTESGSIFVQIGDENVHRVRAVMDEVFGADAFVSSIAAIKTSSATSEYLAGVCDYVLFYAKDRRLLKYRPLYSFKELGSEGTTQYRWSTDASKTIKVRIKSDGSDLQDGFEVFAPDNLTSQRPPGSFPVRAFGRPVLPGKGLLEDPRRRD